ncbi:MAG: hypothetical protein KKB37_04080, partial [Alphaproteobacteria bacterium]|nr:hypothetical protein [Alphaproteobacteria bacterium]
MAEQPIQTYLHLQVACKPRTWRDVAGRIAATATDALSATGSSLYGVWRSQIGRPRDELNVIIVSN